MTFLMVMPSVKYRSTALRRSSIENMRTPIRTPKRPTFRPHPPTDDFSKHVDMRDSPAVTTLRLNQVWDSIPSQLAKENKKFVYGVV